MRNNLYEEFNCKTKEELYEKIKNQEKDVKPLAEFLDYAKANIKNKNTSINNPNLLVEYLKRVQQPSKDTGVVIFINAKSQPVHLKRPRLSRKASMQETIKEGIMAGASSVFLGFSKETPIERIEKVEEYFNKTGLNILDVINHDKVKRTYRSKHAGRIDESYQRYEIVNELTNKYEKNDYSLKDKYEDFASFFASNELMDLNVLDEVDQVKEVLKIGYQHHHQEVFGILIYNSNDKVVAAKELFKGGKDSAIIDLKIIAKSLLNYDDAKGIAIFHNHPSGNTSPSKEDIATTDNIKNMAKVFDIELLDHFIVGKERTLSFAEEVKEFTSDNSYYQGYVSLMREDKESYNKDDLNLEVGDKIKTDLSDKTIVLEMDKDNAILFDGRQYIKAHGLKDDGDKFSWEHGHYFENYPVRIEGQTEDILEKIVGEDYEGFVKALLSIEMGIKEPDLLDELYERYMQNDGVNLINDYFEELIYDLEHDITSDREKDIELIEMSSKEKDIFNKIDGFVDAYTDLSNAMYDIDYDFVEDYPLDKSFHDIDFISWAEASKLNLSEENKEKNPEKTNVIKGKKENIKESTIEKLNKLKDKVAKDSGDELQDKLGDKKKDREI